MRVTKKIRQFGMHKHFDQVAHAKYDSVARETARSFWSHNGWTVTDHPNEYAVDLMAEKDCKRVYIEVEVKRGWHGERFQYDTVHLPLRKAKFLDKPTKFMVFNHSLTHAALFGRRAIQNSTISVVPNSQVSSGEKFYNVPVGDVKFICTLT